MASRVNIDEYLENILNAVYGEEVRSSIHDSIAAMRQIVEEDVTTVDTTLTVSGAAADAKIVGSRALLFKDILEDCDLNELDERGIYRLGSGRTYQNLPRDIATGWIVVLQWGRTGNSLAQWLIESGTSSTKTYYNYLRTANTTETPYTWSNWQNSGLVPDTTLTQAGSPADAKAVGDRFADLEYELIKINSFACEPIKAERGSILNHLDFSWSLSKTPSTGSINGILIPLDQNGTLAMNGRNHSTDAIYTLTVTDEGSPSNPPVGVTKSLTIKFMSRVYFGAAAEPSPINSTFINSLSGTLSETRAMTIDVTAGSGQYIWYALPSSYGTPTFKDAATNLTGGFRRASTIVHTNSFGYSTTYIVWRSDNPSLGRTKVIVS